MIINNESLKKFLIVILNKKAENITEEDLSKIKMVRISNTPNQNEKSNTFSDLKNFGNLEKLVVANTVIKAADISILMSLPSLESLEFEHCAFESAGFLSSLKEIKILILNNCIVADYSFIEKLSNLTELQILNPCDETEFDIALINNHNLLKKLYLEYCILKNIELLKLSELEELSVLNTEINNFNFIASCPNIKLMYISERYEELPIIKENKAKIVFKTNFIENFTEEDELSNSI
ncbi:MAG TPA: hypothetical protein PK737_01420 [Bacilli bacterium]|nr:hypothetical protein [Bacilli bacterium]